MPVELFANLVTTTVSSGGTTAPSAGTTETWTVSSSSGFPAANAGASPPTQFHVADTAPGKSGEIIAVTAVSGTTWTVTRGAESTTPVAHAVGFTVMIDLTAGGLAGMLQAAANLSDVASRQTALNNLAGAVTSGQYPRGNGSNVQMSAIQAADVPQLADYAPTGLTGATAASRYAGATASGAPASGTFAVGDFVIDQAGAIWVCTTAGTPGTWTKLGTVTGVTAADTSIVVGGTAQAPTIRTATLDVIAADHPPAADWSNNSHKITSLANGSAASDAAAFGQIPTSLPPNGAAGGALSGAYPNPGFGSGTMGAFLAPKVAALTFGASIAVDASLGNVFTVTLTASTGTIANPTNPADGQVIRFRITQDATGSRTVAWGTAYDFGSGSAPTLTTTASKTDIVAFEYVATNSLNKWCYLGAAIPQGY